MLCFACSKHGSLRASWARERLPPLASTRYRAPAVTLAARRPVCSARRLGAQLACTSRASRVAHADQVVPAARPGPHPGVPPAETLPPRAVPRRARDAENRDGRCLPRDAVTARTQDATCATDLGRHTLIIFPRGPVPEPRVLDGLPGRTQPDTDDREDHPRRQAHILVMQRVPDTKRRRDDVRRRHPGEQQ